MLRVFVYGTLKRGQRNHDFYCQGVEEISEAITVGQLFDLPFGFPGLRVPVQSVHATGSADYCADALRNGPAVRSMPDAAHPWGPVHGELMAFPDPASLSRLDALEGYTPGEKGLYERVLVPVEAHDETRLAWAYAITREIGSRLPGGRWPA
ncbi:MAG TPA: gamma-glutamylcyclotransferase family protein [Rubrobacteraceae bacterium]|nr:gamma-glutamylcyclotransferase family protein [Rubrobacteraceae bacterium]